jgi:hypothetical protein
LTLIPKSDNIFVGIESSFCLIPRLKTMLTVINRHHYKGGIPDNAIYIGRGTPYGNPYKIEDQRSIDGSELTPEEAQSQSLKRFKGDVWKIVKSFGTDPDVKVSSKIWGELNHLAQRVYNGQAVMLACSCSPLPCHGDVVKAAIENYLLPRYDELVAPFVDSSAVSSVASVSPAGSVDSSEAIDPQPDPVQVETEQPKLDRTEIEQPKPKLKTDWAVGDRVKHKDSRVVDRRAIDDKVYSFSAANRPARQGSVIATPETDPWGVCRGMLLVQWDDNADEVLMSQHPVKHLNQFNIICRPSTVPSSLLESIQ